MARCREKIAENKLRDDLKRMGCPYWPDPFSASAKVWLEGNQAGVQWAREELAARAA